MRKYLSTNNLNIALALACLVTMAGTTARGGQEQGNQAELRWFKGNTHTHSNNQGGDSTPGELARWYREHDYDFLVISDHNYLARTVVLQEEIDRLVEREEKKPFLLIPGEEVTNSLNTEQRSYAIHINGIDTNRTIGQLEDGSVQSLIQKTIDAIRDAGGFPHVNHPNFVWSITADDLYSVKQLRHFEIYNGHPKVNVNGGGGVPSLEEFWDDLLSRGRIYYGVATDDAHNFKEWGRHLSNPGRGWIVVRAPELSRKTVVNAMREGDFYASTGVVLDDLASTGTTLRIKINQARATDNNFELYRTEFIGRGGRVLKADESLEPSYQLKSNDLYVRARVTSSNGSHAWTQPLFAPGEGRFE